MAASSCDAVLVRRAREADEEGVAYDEVDITGDPALEAALSRVVARRRDRRRARVRLPHSARRAAAKARPEPVTAHGARRGRQNAAIALRLDARSRLGGSIDCRRCRKALSLPAGAHAGEEDGQGADLLAGDRRLHEHQRHADPPRPLGLRQVRQARRRLQHRLAARRDPQDPAHAGAAQHRADRRRPPRRGDREQPDLRRARDQRRRGLRHRPGQDRPPRRPRRGLAVRVLPRRRARRTSSSA